MIKPSCQDWDQGHRRAGCHCSPRRHHEARESSAELVAEWAGDLIHEDAQTLRAASRIEVQDEVLAALAGHLAAVLERGPAFLGVWADAALDGDLHRLPVAAGRLAGTVQRL